MTTKLATVSLLLGIFVAGGATGGVITATWMKHAERERRETRFAERRAAMESFPTRQLDRLTTEVGLTPDQRAKVEQITRQTGEDFDRMRRESGSRFHERMQQMHDQIEALLTPEQKLKFAAFHKEQMERVRHDFEEHGTGRGRPPGGEGPPPPPPPER